MRDDKWRESTEMLKILQKESCVRCGMVFNERKCETSGGSLWRDADTLGTLSVTLQGL